MFHFYFNRLNFSIKKIISSFSLSLKTHKGIIFLKKRKKREKKREKKMSSEGEIYYLKTKSRDLIWQAFNNLFMDSMEFVRVNASRQENREISQKEMEYFSDDSRQENNKYILHVFKRFEDNLEAIISGSCDYFFENNLSILKNSCKELIEFPQEIAWSYIRNRYDEKKNLIGFKENDHLVTFTSWFNNTMKIATLRFMDDPSLFDFYVMPSIKMKNTVKAKELIESSIVEGIYASFDWSKIFKSKPGLISLPGGTPGGAPPFNPPFSSQSFNPPPSSQSFNPSSQSFNPSSQSFNPSSQSFNPSSQSFNPPPFYRPEQKLQPQSSSYRPQTSSSFYSPPGGFGGAPPDVGASAPPIEEIVNKRLEKFKNELLEQQDRKVAELKNTARLKFEEMHSSLSKKDRENNELRKMLEFEKSLNKSKPVEDILAPSPLITSQYQSVYSPPPPNQEETKQKPTPEQLNELSINLLKNEASRTPESQSINLDDIDGEYELLRKTAETKIQ
jgi:hypothetical protein